MNYPLVIGLGAATLGVLGVVLLDHLAHGTAHTVLTALMLVLLVAAAIVLHHIALRTERAMERSTRRGEEAPPAPPDSNPRRT